MCAVSTIHFKLSPRVLQLLLINLAWKIKAESAYDTREDTLENQKVQIEDEVRHLTDLLDSVTSAGLTTFQLPSSAHNKFFAADTKINDLGSYDFIVIGAGSGGTIVANRLSEVKSWKILLLEAGIHGNDVTDIPNSPMIFTDYNWGFKSTPQTSACLGMVNNTCMYPRGKGIGGTTLINGLVYSRGHSSDYDSWAQAVQDPRWSYESVLPYFKKTENLDLSPSSEVPINPEYHGTGGPLNVEDHRPQSRQLMAFLRANRELGFDVADYNANNLGASPIQINTVNGQRLDVGKAFITPIEDHRPNLHVMTGSFVTRIKIDGKKAVGVEFTRNGEKYQVEVGKEVVLSAGAIASPQILMLSGIGPKEHLDDMGIEVVENLEVGSALRDHPAFYGLNFETNYREPNKTTEENIREYLEHGDGQSTSLANNQGVAFYESSYTYKTGVPDIELIVLPAVAISALQQQTYNLKDDTYRDVWGNMNALSGFLVFVADLHPISRGTIRLKSKDPFEYPLIDSQFLSDPEDHDLNVMYEGIQLALKLMSTEAFRAMNTTLRGGPLKACQDLKYLSKDYWFCALRQMTAHLYHQMGTCPMGVDPKEGAVVDSELRVHGVKGLRVADASVFPVLPAAHISAPTMMVGERLGDLLKDEYLNTKEAEDRGTVFNDYKE